LRYSDKANLRFGPRNTLIFGLVSIGAALALFSRTPVDGEYLTDVLAPMLLFGLGAGLAFPALMTLAMSGATPSDAGLASGLINTTTQVAGAIGLAVLATLASDRTSGLLADGESKAAALNGGYHLAYLIGAVLLGVALVAALAVLRSPAAQAAAEAAAGEGEAAAGGRPAFSEA